MDDRQDKVVLYVVASAALGDQTVVEVMVKDLPPSTQLAVVLKMGLSTCQIGAVWKGVLGGIQGGLRRAEGNNWTTFI